MFLLFLKSNWRPLAIGVLVLLVYSAGYTTHSYISEAREAETIKKAQQLVIEKQNKWIKDAADADNTYQFKISALRKRYNDVVRMRALNTDLPCFTSPSGKPDDPARTDRLPRPALPELMYQADLQTQQLIALQGWIKSVNQ